MKTNKKISVVLLSLLCIGVASAQINREKFGNYQDSIRQQYEKQRIEAKNKYKSELEKSRQEYAEFRRKANEEYAASLKKAWSATKMHIGEKPPAQPKPKTAPSITKPSVTVSEPLPKPTVVPPPQPVKPANIPEIPNPTPSSPTIQFLFYNTPCSVHASDYLRFRLASLDEKAVANAWKSLSSSKYDGLVHDCLELRKTLRLSDWGYLQLLQGMSYKLFGGEGNENVVLQMYILTQSGIKVRLARSATRLLLLIPFDNAIYSYSFITIDGEKYYAIDKNLSGGVVVCNVAYPGERVAHIAMLELPQLKYSPNLERNFISHKYIEIKLSVATNKNLIDYLNNYPITGAWNCYTQASLSTQVKNALYPTLKSLLRGKSQKEAANMLLDFLQTAFDYATDQDQFGYERPLFGDESFFYPQNDCEDRSILYSILVRELLGLDVVMVNWPGHLATAVCFTENVEGDYFSINGKRYVICDPTYIGASVGMTMPQFKNAEAKIIQQWS